MNRKQRDSNRRNAAELTGRAHQARLAAHVCENCGERGDHWVSIPQSLPEILAGASDAGFWTCATKKE